MRTYLLYLILAMTVGPGVLLSGTTWARDADEILYERTQNAGMDAVEATQKVYSAALGCNLGKDDECKRIPDLKKKAATAAGKWTDALRNFKHMTGAKAWDNLPKGLSQIASMFASSFDLAQRELTKAEPRIPKTATSN